MRLSPAIDPNPRHEVPHAICETSGANPRDDHFAATLRAISTA